MPLAFQASNQTPTFCLESHFSYRSRNNNVSVHVDPTYAVDSSSWSMPTGIMRLRKSRCSGCHRRSSIFYLAMRFTRNSRSLGKVSLIQREYRALSWPTTVSLVACILFLGHYQAVPGLDSTFLQMLNLEMLNLDYAPVPLLC